MERKPYDRPSIATDDVFEDRIHIAFAAALVAAANAGGAGSVVGEDTASVSTVGAA